jgi:hypothetical protein
MMKLTQVMFERVGRRKGYRLVRWSRLGPFHLVRITEVLSGTLCGQRFGPSPQRYDPGEHLEARVCEECWEMFNRLVEVRRLL